MHHQILIIGGDAAGITVAASLAGTQARLLVTLSNDVLGRLGATAKNDST